MNHRRQRLLTVILGMIAIAGLATAAIAQATLQQQYDQQLKNTKKEDPESLYQLARWCYKNGLTNEVLQHALEAAQKAPDDVRLKYLIYALTSTPETAAAGAGETPGEQKLPTIAEADVNALYNAEGESAMRGFEQQVQGVLIARCGSPACHGGADAKTKFSLLRTNLRDRRTVAENFLAIGKYLNREEPDRSRLLIVPSKGPEAGHPKQVLRGETDSAYGKIRAWIANLRKATQKIWQ